jgi:hypothetical protein
MLRTLLSRGARARPIVHAPAPAPSTSLIIQFNGPTSRSFMRRSQPAAAPFLMPTFLRLSLLAVPQIWARISPFVLYNIHKKADAPKQPSTVGQIGATSSAVSFTPSASATSASIPASDDEPKKQNADEGFPFARYLKLLNSVMWWVSGACVIVVFVDSIERVPFTGRWHVVLLTPDMEVSSQHSTLTGIFKAHGLPAPGSATNDNSDASVTSASAADEEEAQMLQEAAAKRPKPLASFDAKTRETAQRVFDSLIAVIDPQLLRDRPEVKFQLHFLDSNEWNACALTAGAVVLYSGMSAPGRNARGTALV